MRWFFALLCVMAGFVAAAQAPPAVVLRAGEAYRVPLSPAMGVLRDSARTLTPEQAWQALNRSGFKPLGAIGPSFGYTRDVVWLHARIENRSHPAQRWVLVIEQPRLDRLKVFVRTGAGAVLERDIGDNEVFAARSHPHRFPNVEFALATGAVADVLLRVESDSAMQVPAVLYTPNELYRASHDQQAAGGVYYGILLALLLFNAGLFFATRERAYRWFVVYIAAMALWMLAYDGTGFQYLWPQWPWFQNAALPVALGLSLAASALVSRDYLELRARLPWAALTCDYAAIVGAVLGIAGLVPMLRFWCTAALNAVIVILAIVVTVAAVIVLMRRYRAALYFLIAWAVLMAGGGAVPLASLGLLPRPALVDYAAQFGSAGALLLLSFAFVRRAMLVRIEQERVDRETRESLERRLADRTRELEQAAAQLEELNRLLRDISLRDGLTGLYNRRFLDQLLVEAWNASLARREPLSVMMVDLDRFKNINDRYGHAAGDDCLRVVAARMSRQANTLGAVAARYGGEEFAVVLAGKPREMADGLAELMRSAVAGEPVKTSVGAIAVTISVGLASMVPKKGDTLSVFIKRADQALYEAKRRGRNQVVVA